MAKTKTVKAKIGMRELKALGPDSELLDTSILGFRARRQSGPAIVFALVYRRRSDGKQRRATIGRWGALTPDQARQEAQRLAGVVALGGDPAGDRRTERDAPTMNELFAEYLAAAKAGRILGRRGTPKKAITQYQDANAIRAHLSPLLGDRKVRDVTRKDVERAMHSIANGATARSFKGKPRGVSRITGGKGAATRTIGLLGSIFSYARDHGMRDDSPVSKVRKFAEERRDRRLSDAEFAALATGLSMALDGGTWPPAVNALRFLALTGWRSGEALGLRWRDVDLVRRIANLSDTKTGKSMRPLSHAAADMLRSLPRTGDNDLVFPASRGGVIMGGFKRHVRKIIDKAGLPSDVTPHVLRHSYVSVAAELGLSDMTIGSLVGHRGQSITSRYAHFSDAPLLAAADAVAAKICLLMGEAEKSGQVIELRRV